MEDVFRRPLYKNMKQKTHISKQIKELDRQQKKLEAQRSELSKVGPMALDKEFVYRHYSRVDAEIKQIQAERFRLQNIQAETMGVQR